MLVDLVKDYRVAGCMQSLNCRANERAKAGKPIADMNLLLVKYWLLNWVIINTTLTAEEKEELDCWLNENGC